MKNQTADLQELVRDVADRHGGLDFIETARKLMEITDEACAILRETYCEMRKCTATKKKGSRAELGHCGIARSNLVRLTTTSRAGRNCHQRSASSEKR